MSDEVTRDEAVLALSAATEYVETFCRKAGVSQIRFSQSAVEVAVEVFGVTRSARGRTLEDALRRLYASEVRS